ncbi:MAG: hypothetical protein M0R66_10290 [Candidatus Omnitrophica bacterium]|nr:hypothetical protein [Candidatus Omnitrophota bacterium]
MRVSVLNQKQVIYAGNVKEAVLPGEDGEFSVLDFHQPFLYRLRSGFIFLKGIHKENEEAADSKEVKTENRIRIKDGVARMLGNELVICIT